MAGKELELRVIEAPQSDVGLGRARIDTRSRQELGVEVGDLISITGKRTTGVKLFRVLSEDEGKGIIRMDGLVRRNAEVSIGDRVTVRRLDAQEARKVVLAPVIHEKHKISFGAGIDSHVRNGLRGRPVTLGDTVIIPGIALMGGALPFLVINVTPTGPALVRDTTKFEVQSESAKEEAGKSMDIHYEDIGGLGDQLTRIREIIEHPLKHPELFERLGIGSPKGVLLFGPPGTGKTLIAKAVATEAGAYFISIQGPEIISKYYGQSEEKLRERFEEASANAPSVIFIDEIDSIAPRRDDVQGEVERRVVAQLLTLMDGLSSRENVIVIAATNREDALDPALRRPGRFDREIEIGVPDRLGRLEILQIHTRGMPLTPEVDLESIAAVTHGFVGADLAALAREAAMKALRRYMPYIDMDGPLDPEFLRSMEVTMDDFRLAQRSIEPSGLREYFVEVPKVSWDQVGGLDAEIASLQELIEATLSDPERFRKLGIRPPGGVLLYGPPGTGKTLLAKALATGSGVNFLAIKGPEVMSKWVGESEKALRNLFKKAKQVAPTILFLDELDAIAPPRTLGTDSGASLRVVNQLLSSMDGIEGLDGVLLVAATNRPDQVDPALLRSGRFDRMHYLGAPDEAAREAILKVHTREMPTKGVDIQHLVKLTQGFVGADLAGLCREAGMAALRRKKNAATVLARDFEEAMDRVRPSVSEEMLKYYEQMRESLESGIGKRVKKAPIDPLYS